MTVEGGEKEGEEHQEETKLAAASRKKQQRKKKKRRKRRKRKKRMTGRALASQPKRKCLFVWGSGRYGQLARLDERQVSPVPTRVEHFRRKSVRRVACGARHMAAIVFDDGERRPGGDIYTWGHRAALGRSLSEAETAKGATARSPGGRAWTHVPGKVDWDGFQRSGGACAVACGRDFCVVATLPFTKVPVEEQYRRLMVEEGKKDAAREAAVTARLAASEAQWAKWKETARRQREEGKSALQLEIERAARRRALAEAQATAEHEETEAEAEKKLEYMLLSHEVIACGGETGGREKLADFDEPTLVKTAWNLAKLDKYDERLLKDLCHITRRRMGRLTATQLSKLAWAVAYLNFTLDQQFANALAKHARLKLNEGEFDSSEVADIIWAVALLRTEWLAAGKPPEDRDPNAVAPSEREGSPTKELEDAAEREKEKGKAGDDAASVSTLATRTTAATTAQISEFSEEEDPLQAFPPRHPDDEKFLAVVADRLDEVHELADCSALQVANCLWALAKLQYRTDELRMKPEAAPVLAFAENLIKACVIRAPLFNPEAAANVLWALATMRWPKEEVRNERDEEYRRKIEEEDMSDDDDTEEELLAKRRRRHRRLMREKELAAKRAKVLDITEYALPVLRAVTRRARDTIELGQWSPGMLANVIWACSHYEYHDKRLVEVIAKQAFQGFDFTMPRYFNAHGLTKLVHGLAKFDHYSKELMAALSGPAAMKIKGYSIPELFDLMCAYVKLEHFHIPFFTRFVLRITSEGGARIIQEHVGDAAVKKFKEVIADLDAVFVDQLVRNPECTFDEEVRAEIEVVLLEIERKEEEEAKLKKKRRQAREAAAAAREEREREEELDALEDAEENARLEAQLATR